MPEEPSNNSRTLLSSGLLPTSEVVDLWRQAGAQHEIAVTGGSMLPLLREGDVLVVDHNLDRVRFGEIIVFQSADLLIAHRVIRIIRYPNGKRIFLTRGDSSPQVDPLVDDRDLLGRAVAVRRGKRMLALDNSILYLLSGNLLAFMMKIEAALYPLEPALLGFSISTILGKSRRSVTRFLCRWFLRWT